MKIIIPVKLQAIKRLSLHSLSISLIIHSISKPLCDHAYSKTKGLTPNWLMTKQGKTLYNDYT